MVYTNNVPQGNQQIATTQPLIQANFGFLQTAINQEHNFNAADPTLTYHLKASMPNMADPIALPLGTNGMYYVNGGAPKFYNGTAFFLTASSIASSFFNGTVTLGSGATQNIAGITGDFSGNIMVFRGDNADGTFDCANFFQNAAASLSRVIHYDSSGNNTPYVIWNGTSLAITNASGSSRTFHYAGWVVPTV